LKKSSHVFGIPKLQNFKNSFHKIWYERKIIAIFASQKFLTMRPTGQHRKMENWFSPLVDHTSRGAYLAIE